MSDDDPMSDDSMSADLSRVGAVPHSGDPVGVNDPGRDRPADRCERCSGDGELALMTAPNGNLVRVHPTCGDLCRCTLIPPCTGASDLCGAPAGQPCAPGCPGLADDPNRSDPRLTNG